jgi:hypothetical protein
MSKINITIEEQLTDSRSNEIAYRFAIENNNNVAVQVISIIPRIPEDVKILVVKDPSLQEVSSMQNDICRSLEGIANSFLEEELKKSKSWYSRDTEITVTTSKEKQDRLKTIVEVLIESINILARLPLKLAFPFASFEIETTEQKVPDSMRISIHNYKEGLEIYNTFLENSEIKESIKKIFYTKLEKLKEIESTLNHNTTNFLAVIEPDSFFALTYVLRFKRNVTNSKKYNIYFECCYCEAEDNRKLISGASTNLNIAPEPSILTVVSIIGSVFGIILKVSMKTTYNNAPTKFFDELWNTSISGEPIICAIISLIFFNVYEHTEFSGKLKMNLNWRYALLIGVICGLLGERIIKAFQAFLG